MIPKTIPRGKLAEFPEISEQWRVKCPQSLSLGVLNYALELKSQGKEATPKLLDKKFPGRKPETIRTWMTGLRRIGVLPSVEPAVKKSAKKAPKSSPEFKHLNLDVEVVAASIENKNTALVYRAVEKFFSQHQRIPTAEEISRRIHLREDAIEVHFASLQKMGLGPWVRRRGQWRDWKPLNDVDKFKLHYANQAAVLIKEEGR